MAATPDVLQTADDLWTGRITTERVHPVVLGTAGLAEIGDGVAFVPSFANVSAVDTDDGLFLVDTGSSFAAGRGARRPPGLVAEPAAHRRLLPRPHRPRLRGARVGVGVGRERMADSGGRGPRGPARALRPLHQDGRLTTPSSTAASSPSTTSSGPLEYRYPDRTYRDRLDLEVGGVRAELHHARGETDDHTWTWFPERRVLCCGDLFIWASPNAGNPQKVQRYPLEWADALRRMLALYDRPEGGPTALLPGHGFPVIGEDRIRQALSDTAALLESLVEQTLALMNQGARLDEVLHTVTPPAELMARPYLQPVYDEPEFVVRTVWRRYGGWWDGNPATLKPAPGTGPRHRAGRPGRRPGCPGRPGPRPARRTGGDDAALRLAGHLAEMAWLAAPDDPAIGETRRRVFSTRADAASSTMAHGVFAWAARES